MDELLKEKQIIIHIRKYSIKTKRYFFKTPKQSLSKHRKD